MALFSNWFKGKPDGSNPGAGSSGEDASAPPENPQPSPVSHVPSVRTVQPNPSPVARSADGPRSPISLTSPTSAPGASHMRATTRKISFGASEHTPAMAPEHHPVDQEPPPGPSEPDAVVRLELNDFIDRIPTNFLLPGEVDRQQTVEFLVSELYSDLSRGRATVPASVIYRKCPDIFARPVSDTEDVEVHLPLHRLVEQMASTLAPRADQTQEESVAEIETPFLQVALEDNARLPKAAGTSMGATVRAIGLPGVRRPVPSIQPPTVQAEPENRSARHTKQISPISPLKQPMETRTVASPTAQTAGPINPSKRPPSTVRASVAGGKIRLSAPAAPPQSKPVITPAVPRTGEGGMPKVHMPASPRMPSVSPSHQVTKKTARIQIPPISLRPAAPGGPRPPSTPVVPPPSAAPRAPEALTSFRAASGSPPPPPMSPPTFRSAPPPPSYAAQPASFSPSRAGLPPISGATPETPEAGLTEASNAPTAEPSVSKDQLIEMSLAGVLRGLPSMSLVVEPTSIPDSARISLPFGLIEPQLSNGRVTISLETFRSALPSAFNHVLADDCDLTEVPIPLQEVFQNLPSNAISQRGDQIVEEARNSFPTPFSQKAEEDARRFSAAAPAAPESIAPAAEPAAIVDAPALEKPEAIESAPEVPFEEEVVLEAAMPLPKLIVAEEAVEEPFAEPEPPATAPEPEEFQIAEGPLKEAGDPLESLVAEELTPVAELIPLPALIPAGPEPVKFAEPIAKDVSFAASPELTIPELKLVSTPAPVRAADSKLQTLFMTEDDLDAKGIAKLVSQMPGIESCSVMFDDGLLLAGSLPQDGKTEGFSAMAPALFQRVLNFTNELSLGELQACTVYTDRGLLSLFSQGNICLSVRHVGRGFLPGVREKLVIVTRELAGMYGPAKAEAPESTSRD